jgi:hypothetical protein
MCYILQVLWDWSLLVILIILLYKKRIVQTSIIQKSDAGNIEIMNTIKIVEYRWIKFLRFVIKLIAFWVFFFRKKNKLF